MFSLHGVAMKQQQQQLDFKFSRHIEAEFSSSALPNIASSVSLNARYRSE
jgi:hypothetical protein